MAWLFVSCSSGIQPRTTYLQKVNYSQLDGWQYDNHLAALDAFKKSCDAILQQRNTQVSNLTLLGGKKSQWVKPCKDAQSGRVFTNKMAKKFFEKWFDPYRITPKSRHDGLYTGYYEVEIQGSRRKTAKYKHPVYRKPKNLHKLQGSRRISHKSINNGSLSGKNLEIVWVDDKAKLHFMHIQGCGSIKLANGRELKLGYDGQNGHPYRAIGPQFKKYSRSRIDSALDMMSWLKRNPRDGKKIMESNPSYIFFKKITGTGPIGGQGVSLTPERSMAVDAGLYPYGMPIWVQTKLPKTKNYRARNYRRLFIAQDTGGSIKGAIRGDVFFGKGKRAEEMACYMNQRGTAYALFPKSVYVPSSYTSKKY